MCKSQSTADHQSFLGCCLYGDWFGWIFEASPFFHSQKKTHADSIRVAARKLQAEIDLLRVKLATAERELAKMDGLKAEIERLKQQVSDRDKKIEVP